MFRSQVKRRSSGPYEFPSLQTLLAINAGNFRRGAGDFGNDYQTMKNKRAFKTQKQRDAAEFKAMIARESARLDFQHQHPVSSGVIPLVEYKEPKWRYGR